MYSVKLFSPRRTPAPPYPKAVPSPPKHVFSGGHIPSSLEAKPYVTFINWENSGLCGPNGLSPACSFPCSKTYLKFPIVQANGYRQVTRIYLLLFFPPCYHENKLSKACVQKHQVITHGSSVDPCPTVQRFSTLATHYTHLGIF